MMASLFRLCIWIHSMQCLTSVWLEIATIPAPDSQWAVGSYRRSIYLLGGWQNSHGFTQYSIAANSFTVVEPAPSPSIAVSGYGQFWTQHDNILYMALESDTSVLTAFDLMTQTFLDPDPLFITPQDAGSYKCLASSNDYVYVTGGYDTPDRVQILRMSTKQWKVSSLRMIKGRAYHTCAVHSGYLYVFGGYLSDTYLSSSERAALNALIATGIGTKYFQSSVPLQYAIIYARAVSCGNRIFVVGGSSPDAVLNTVHVIDPSQQTVSLETMPYALAAVGTICFQQAIYVFGGYSDGSHSLYYNTITPNPTQYPSTATKDPTMLPSRIPSAPPTRFPSVVPSHTPSNMPSETPTDDPMINVQTTDDPMIKVETTDESESDDKREGAAPEKQGLLSNFTSNQLILTVGLLILTVVLLLLLLALLIVKRKREQSIQENIDQMEKQQRSMHQDPEGNDKDTTTVEEVAVPKPSPPNEEDILAQVLALSIAEEEERKQEQIAMMKRFSAKKNPKDMNDANDDDAQSEAESAHDSDEDVLKTDKITTAGNDEIVDEYKQDIEDVMDNPASPNYDNRDEVALNTGTIQSGIGLASADTDSDDDVLSGAGITMGAASVNHDDEDEIMFQAGDLPESDNSDDDVLMGGNIGVTMGGGATRTELDGEDHALPMSGGYRGQ